MSVLHTLKCQSFILLNVSPLYSNMSMLYTVIYQLPTLSYSDMPALYTVICRCFQCAMVVYRRGRHCHTWVHTTDSLWMDNQNTFLFLLLDTFYLKTINIWLWLGVMVFNVTFNNISVISWRSVLLVGETRCLIVFNVTSTIFQLYRGSQFYWWMQSETINL
jgi:hypothetical protein